MSRQKSSCAVASQNSFGEGVLETCRRVEPFTILARDFLRFAWMRMVGRVWFDAVYSDNALWRSYVSRHVVGGICNPDLVHELVSPSVRRVQHLQYTLSVEEEMRPKQRQVLYVRRPLQYLPIQHQCIFCDRHDCLIVTCHMHKEPTSGSVV